jgi:hypothetical protein
MTIAGSAYEPYLQEIMKLYGQKKEQAGAGAIGEAMRRGLVNPKGTSDIESVMRKAAVSPIEQAESGAITDLGRSLADREAQQKWGTAERLGGQDWQSGENLAQRGWQTGERLGSQGWQTGERMGSQDWQGGQSQLQRDWQAQQNQYNQDLEKYLQSQGFAHEKSMQPKAAKWYQGGLGSLAGGFGGILGKEAGGGIVGGIKKLFSDIRLKKNLKPLATLYEFEYNDDNKKYIGFVAQEIEKIIPEAISEEGGYKQIDYNKVFNVIN